MGDFFQEKVDLSFIFKNGNYYQWSFILRGKSLGICFYGVNYLESNYPGMELSQTMPDKLQ